ncbi:MAG: hypothetical protein Q9M50_06490 [Methylococcales bacterium]|nr:hypothetical protein [Methylococcales bacterium]
MFNLLKLFFDIALLKKSPQDVPASLLLQRMIIAIYLFISILLRIISENGFKVVLEVGVDLLFMFLFCRFILFWVGKPKRFQQMFIALLGVDALISFCAFPAIATLNTPMPEKSSFFLLGIFSFIVLILWHWVAAGHIFHHALSKPFIIGLGVALLYLMLSYQLNALLFSEIAME